MTATFFLVRHATHPLVGRVLVGRGGNVPLAGEGRQQAGRLARRFAAEDIAAVQTSPQVRARDTAIPIAAAASVVLETAAALDEIDVGEWAGREFAELNADPAWQIWNSRRSTAQAPAGESMRSVQERAVTHLEHMRAFYPARKIVLVSHADIIKAIVLHYLGLSLDAHQRIEVAPASVTTIVAGDWGSKVVALNEAVRP